MKSLMHLAPLVLALLGQAAAIKQRSMITGSVHARAFVRSIDFRQRLRVCNAYPSHYGMMLVKGKEELTQGSPMAYKECRDMSTNLQPGDRLDFKVDDSTSAGSFKVNELPSHDAVLLLIIERHDTLSTAVSFESHVFAHLQNAQLAVIDTYKGVAASTPHIRDATDGGSANQRSERLRYDSVVAVNPGLYEVVLEEQTQVKARSALVALNHESYVVLRVGVEAQGGQSFPQEIVVYPRSKVSELKGGASQAGLSGLLAIAMAMVAFSS